MLEMTGSSTHHSSLKIWLQQRFEHIEMLQYIGTTTILPDV